MEEAFEQCAIAMFGYMTELERVEVKQVHHVEAEGHDMQSLLFHFLDELLFMFCAEPFLVARVCFELRKAAVNLRVKITEFDPVNFKIKARAAGEEFVIGKHTQGAEVKAITYSAMQIHDRPEVERPELFVIVDI
ncbi:hypothetical protein TSAR_013137 [Trichomalopsis sarcophagae]|uniref:Archease domain-containing protein n=1 Tax=Trichomalopsis sarcophagae TaxID=543379 RepID=A0A232FI69_9HYME|nr:hypothetical protein TSAR_013137 [Trichomalopsis sarcophagae]